jgi:hypothetical protein
VDLLILHHVLQVADHPRHRQVIAVEDERLVHVEADRERRPHALKVDAIRGKKIGSSLRDGPNLVRVEPSAVDRLTGLVQGRPREPRSLGLRPVSIVRCKPSPTTAPSIPRFHGSSTG